MYAFELLEMINKFKEVDPSIDFSRISLSIFVSIEQYVVSDIDIRLSYIKLKFRSKYTKYGIMNQHIKLDYLINVLSKNKHRKLIFGNSLVEITEIPYLIKLGKSLIYFYSYNIVNINRAYPENMYTYVYKERI